MIKYIIFILLLAMQLIAQTAKKNDIPGGAQIVTNEVDPVSLPVAQTALQRATEAKAAAYTNSIQIEGKLDIPRVRSGTGIRVDNDGRSLTINATGITEPVPSFSPTNVTAVYDATNFTAWVEFRGKEVWMFSLSYLPAVKFSDNATHEYYPGDTRLAGKTFEHPFSIGLPYEDQWVYFVGSGYNYYAGSGSGVWGFNGSIYVPVPSGSDNREMVSGTITPTFIVQTNIFKVKLGSFVLRDIATNITWEVVASNGFFEVKPQ